MSSRSVQPRPPTGAGVPQVDSGRNPRGREKPTSGDRAASGGVYPGMEKSYENRGREDSTSAGDARGRSSSPSNGNAREGAASRRRWVQDRSASQPAGRNREDDVGTTEQVATALRVALDQAAKHPTWKTLGREDKKIVGALVAGFAKFDKDADRASLAYHFIASKYAAPQRKDTRAQSNARVGFKSCLRNALDSGDVEPEGCCESLRSIMPSDLDMAQCKNDVKRSVTMVMDSAMTDEEEEHRFMRLATKKADVRKIVSDVSIEALYYLPKAKRGRLWKYLRNAGIAVVAVGLAAGAYRLHSQSVAANKEVAALKMQLKDKNAKITSQGKAGEKQMEENKKETREHGDGINEARKQHAAAVNEHAAMVDKLHRKIEDHQEQTRLAEAKGATASENFKVEIAKNSAAQKELERVRKSVSELQTQVASSTEADAGKMDALRKVLEDKNSEIGRKEVRLQVQEAALLHAEQKNKDAVGSVQDTRKRLDEAWKEQRSADQTKNDLGAREKQLAEFVKLRDTTARIKTLTETTGWRNNPQIREEVEGLTKTEQDINHRISGGTKGQWWSYLGHLRDEWTPGLPTIPTMFTSKGEVGRRITGEGSYYDRYYYKDPTGAFGTIGGLASGLGNYGKNFYTYGVFPTATYAADSASPEWARTAALKTGNAWRAVADAPHNLAAAAEGGVQRAQDLYEQVPSGETMKTVGIGYGLGVGSTLSGLAASQPLVQSAARAVGGTAAKVAVEVAPALNTFATPYVQAAQGGLQIGSSALRTVMSPTLNLLSRAPLPIVQAPFKVLGHVFRHAIFTPLGIPRFRGG